MTSFEEFRSLTGRGNVIPVFDALEADTETPVSVYLKVRGDSPYSFLLESVEGGERVGRYSFIGIDPFMLAGVRGGTLTLTPRHEDVVVLPAAVHANDAPLDALNRIFSHFSTAPVPGLPRFTGGAVGFFGYESIRLTERIPVAKSDELGQPDISLMFCDTILIFDNIKHEVSVISNGYVPSGTTDGTFIRSEYEKAVREIERLKTLLRTPSAPSATTSSRTGELIRRTEKKDYCAAVDRIKDYIRAGDVFQVVLSQRMKAEFDGDSFDVYRALRRINPSPYMYYFDFNGLEIVGASPELLVRVEHGKVETRPIAGTRRRGASADEDARLAAELLADEKERAEHLMLVDLGRNDLGRIAEYGTVQVTEFMQVEKYSHVMHIVSSVEGKLRDDVSPLDALYACFPAGTVSGAPKIRAMEIIAELEPVQRGVYGGAVGYIDFSGNLDSCIAIRTIVHQNGTLYFQAGAGIVYDSIPEREYEETLEKLSANLRAVEQSAGR